MRVHPRCLCFAFYLSAVQGYRWRAETDRLTVHTVHTAKEGKEIDRGGSPNGRFVCFCPRFVLRFGQLLYRLFSFYTVISAVSFDTPPDPALFSTGAALSSTSKAINPIHDVGDSAHARVPIKCSSIGQDTTRGNCMHSMER